MNRMIGFMQLSLAVGLLGYSQPGQIVPNTPPVPAACTGRKNQDQGRRAHARRPEVRGTSMGTVIIVGALIFAIGVVAGVIVIVSLGIKREERDFLRTGLTSMTRRA